MNPTGVIEHSPGSRVRERTLGNSISAVDLNPNGVTELEPSRKVTPLGFKLTERSIPRVRTKRATLGYVG